MSLHSAANPDVVKVNQKFSLVREDEAERNGCPYEVAVMELRLITEYVSPLSKLECMGR